MNILLLAPHPFYQDRGTPIAVNLVLKVLSERGDNVDVLTFHEGRAVDYPNVSIYRIPAWSFLGNIRPGFSWKKLVCDGLLCAKLMVLLCKKRYHLIHAVEESAFMALVVHWIARIPYLYDMDSSLAQQMIEKYPGLDCLAKAFMLCERRVVQSASVVLPVCEALAKRIEPYHPSKVMLLEDIPLLGESTSPLKLNRDLDVPGIRILYVGNLETYQGIDLLLDSFALALKEAPQSTLFIVGGEKDNRVFYKHQAERLGIEGNVHFLGPRPLDQLPVYLSQADILVSPRIKGNNTPMKLYSYLASGKAVLATNLLTHTQVINRDVALLADPTPESFGEGMLQLIKNQDLRRTLGLAARKLVDEKYSFPAFRMKLNAAYDYLRETVQQPSRPC
ncbi:glycosyltransferase family 4 protein [uncultured Nitrospira sp.]|uniref:glycosyltransferase family 4 protein n=1 Tax=uncultured Nitrospira sp. TaxID=157176 RepID=UPI00313FF0B4